MRLKLSEGHVVHFLLVIILSVLGFFMGEGSSRAFTLEKDPITLTQTAPRPAPKDEKKGPDEVPATPTYRLPEKFDKFLAKGPLNPTEKRDDKETKLRKQKEKNWWRRFFHFF